MGSVGDEVRVRRRLFEERLEWVVSWNEARQPELRCTCPCCGYPTLMERDSYEICELCDWEDGGQDDPDADKNMGGPNRGSLTHARENFARHLSEYDAEELNDGDFAKDSMVEYQAKRTMMEAFDAMVEEEDPPFRSVRWQRVYDAESELARKFNRKVEEYEARLREQGST